MQEVKLTCCDPNAGTPLRLKYSLVGLFLKTLILEGLLGSREYNRILGVLANYVREQVTLEFLEGVSPSDIYLLFRWLRGFFTSKFSKSTNRFSLIPTLPYASTTAILATAWDFSKEIKVTLELPQSPPQAIIRAVKQVSNLLGFPMTIEKSNSSLIHPVWIKPPFIDLLKVTMGTSATLARDVLGEVMESGGSITSRALFELVGRDKLSLIKRLLDFDFLSIQSTQGGFVFCLTKKGLESTLVDKYL